MSNLNDKVISSNFQKLLQISHSTHAVLDGTGSAFGLRMSGSNIAINTAPADGIDLAVAGTISASIISASTGVFGANTVFIGGVRMTENDDGGIRFQDSGSNELGAFAGPGYFVLTSSLEEHGAARPLFSLTQQVGSKLNENLAQINSQGVKIAQSFNVNSAELKFGLQPSASTQAGDFFISLETGIFTVNPSPDGRNEPSFYVTQSGRRIGMGMYPNNENMLTLGGGSGTGSNRGGGLFVSGSDVGHITASGNIQATSMSLGVGFPAPNTTLTVKGNISASGTVFADAFQSVTGGSTIDFNDSLDLTGNITASGDISSSGDISAKDLFVDSNITHGGDPETKISFANDTIAMIAGNTTFMTAVETAQDVLTFGDGTDIDYRFRTSGSTHNLFIQGDTNNIGIGTSTPRAQLDVQGTLSSSGEITVNGKTYLSSNGNITSSGAISMSNTAMSHILGGDLTVGDDLTVSDDLTVGDDLTFGGNISGSYNSTGSFGRLDLSDGGIIAPGASEIASVNISTISLLPTSSNVSIGGGTNPFMSVFAKRLHITDVLASGNQISASGFSVSSSGEVSCNDLHVTGAIESTGNTVFGNHATNDTHTFTGPVEVSHLNVTGSKGAGTSPAGKGNITASGVIKTTYNGENSFEGSISAGSTIKTLGSVSASATVFADKYESRGEFIAGFSGADSGTQHFGTTGFNNRYHGLVHSFTGSMRMSGSITAHSIGPGRMDGSTDSRIEFALPNSYDDGTFKFISATRELFRISESAHVIVGDGGDVDFQVKSNGDDNAIFVQGNTDRVGIGNPLPAQKLTVNGNISASGALMGVTNITASGEISAGTLKVNAINTIGNITASGNISASGIITAEGLVITDDFSLTDDLTIGGEITASGNISSSGTIIGSNLSGTNTGDVSLGGSLDYITISGQTITRNAIDLAADVTGVLPSANLDADTAHLTTTQTFSGNKTFSSAITASGNISSSGNISATGTLRADGNVDFNSDLDVDGTTQLDNTVITGSLKLSGEVNIAGGGQGHITASGNAHVGGKISATGDLLISGDKVDFTALPTSSVGANTKGLFTQLGSEILGSGSAGSDERVKFNNFSASKFVLIKE